MAKIKPAERPQVKREVIEALLKGRGVTEKCAVVGVRGYYLDTMGVVGKNDRGIYDDALIFIGPEAYVTFNGNVDPVGVKKGRGTGSKKGRASLKKGLYRVHTLDLHKGQYLALCQRKGKVTVIRDGLDGDYEDTGMFGINIHRGGLNAPSSIGCQTIYPDQWKMFITLAKEQMTRYKMKVIPYLLIDESELYA